MGGVAGWRWGVLPLDQAVAEQEDDGGLPERDGFGGLGIGDGFDDRGGGSLLIVGALRKPAQNVP